MQTIEAAACWAANFLSTANLEKDIRALIMMIQMEIFGQRTKNQNNCHQNVT